MSALQQAADAIWNARVTRTAIPPLREWLAADALSDAYAVQTLNTKRRESHGARRVGRKIGLTSVAVQRQLGVDQPDFGVLFDRMVHRVAPGATVGVPIAPFLQPKIEGEIAFIVASDITVPHMSREDLLGHAGEAAAAFEIVDSAIKDWRISLADTVADNASCGAIVLGEQRVALARLDTRLAGMVLSENGTIVSLGVGAASLGDPLEAFAWLANTAIALGDPIRAGEIVLTGALGPMVPLIPGNKYRLEIAGFSAIEVVAVQSA